MNKKIIKNIIFIFATIVFIFDFLLMPFVSEPFTFYGKEVQNYVLGVLFAIAVWAALIYLNFSKLENFKFLSFSVNEKYNCYYLKTSLIIVTSLVIGLFIFGSISIIDRYEIGINNLLLFCQN